MSTVFPIAVLKIKRPAASWVQVGGLRSASLELEAETFQGSAVQDGSANPWQTTGQGVSRWQITAEAIPDAVTNTGLVAYVAACRGGERVEVELTFGDGRRSSGLAYAPGTGRGGSANGLFTGSLTLVGTGRLWGTAGSEVAGEAEYPDAPINLAAAPDVAKVALTWDAVADDATTGREVDGYYVYWGLSSGRYENWRQLSIADLTDNLDGTYSYEVTTLPAVLHYFRVTAFWDDGSS
jgi:hypothetical protein